MKRLRYLIIFVLTAAVTLLSAACGGEETLRAPGGLFADDNDLLTWSAVPNARSYQIEIVEVPGGARTEATSHRTNYSLASLEEGDYDVRVRAVGGSHNEAISEWSETLGFERVHETGLIYGLINQNTEYEIRGAGTASGELAFDGIYRGRPVTRIAEGAFRSNANLTSVVIPDTVTSIGTNAFYNCSSLTSLTIPESVTEIGEYAFYGCSSLESVTLPESITEVPGHAFAYCRGLVSVGLGEGVTSIGESAFYACSALEDVALPDGLTTIGSYAFSLDNAIEEVRLGSGLTELSDYAFYNSDGLATVGFSELSGELTVGAYVFGFCDSLKSIDLPEGVTSIGVYCFRASALEEITIPSSVASIGAEAFAETPLLTSQAEKDYQYADDWLIKVSQDVVLNATEINQNTFDRDVVGFADQAFLGYVTSEEDGSTTLQGCVNVTNITLPSSLKYIGQYAFCYMPRLRAVYTVAGCALADIGDYAFMEDPLLNNVRFGNAEKLRSIGTYAFYNCSMLDNNANNPEELVPTGVNHIGAYAFYNTRLWNSDTVTDGIVYAGSWVVGFREDMSSAIVDLREETRGISDFAFLNCETIQNLSGLGQVRYIGTGAFYGCTELSSVSFDVNLRVIEPYTFFKCYALLSVTFSTSLESIGACAFGYCQQLTRIDLSESRVTEIGDFAFYDCENAREIDLGIDLTSISGYAFYQNMQVKEITIPDTVVSIGTRAFGLCSALETVTFGEGLETIDDYAFRDCTALTAIILPDSVKTVGRYAFYDCPAVETLVLGAGTETIGDYAFYGLSALRSVTIPAGVKTIGAFAFKGCTMLNVAVFAGDPEMVDSNAFYGCDYLTVYAAGEENEDWSGSWNSSHRPVFYGTSFAEDGYVVSVQAGQIDNDHSRFGISAPARSGYTFKGWATEEGGDAVYGMSELGSVPAGTTLYAVWERSGESAG